MGGRDVVPRKPSPIDDYLASVREGHRTALGKLRRVIRSAAPEAEECISYRVAAFRQNGMLVGFGATGPIARFT
jgi:uncharacterized protein YdhG (YjbR/CyaY superfamily)